MFDGLFDEKLQIAMTNFFIDVVSPLGRVKAYAKGDIIQKSNADEIYIVLDGVIDQVFISEDGELVSFFRLDRGTIFGEMDYLDGQPTGIMAKAASTAAVSVVHRHELDELMMARPELYKHFSHSIIRKFRIMMLKYADVRFNDALGRLASTLLRLSCSTGYRSAQDVIGLKYTHEEIAQITVLNRATVTSGLNRFKDEGLITINKRRIKILDVEGLKAYTNSYLDT